jgi:hypothetical protein
MGVVAAVLLPLALLARPASAAPSAADRETARGLLDQGDRDFAQRDFAAALRAYHAADALMHVPTTAIEVARVQVELGQLIEARETALAIWRSPHQPDEPAAFARARDAAVLLANSVAARIPSLLVTVSGLPAGVTPRISVDGDPVPIEVAGLPRKVDPGRHTVLVTAPGYAPVSRDVSVAEQAHVSVEAPMSEATAGLQPPPLPITDKPAPSKALSYTLWGVGGAGVLGGATTGILSMTTTSDARKYCNAYGVCRQAAQPDLNHATALAWASDIAFGVGLVGAAVGTLLYFTGPREKPTGKFVTFRLTASPARSGGVLGVKGKF